MNPLKLDEFDKYCDAMKTYFQKIDNTKEYDIKTYPFTINNDNRFTLLQFPHLIDGSLVYLTYTCGLGLWQCNTEIFENCKECKDFECHAQHVNRSELLFISDFTETFYDDDIDLTTLRPRIKEDFMILITEMIADMIEHQTDENHIYIRKDDVKNNEYNGIAITNSSDVKLKMRFLVAPLGSSVTVKFNVCSFLKKEEIDFLDLGLDSVYDFWNCFPMVTIAKRSPIPCVSEYFDEEKEEKIQCQKNKRFVEKEEKNIKQKNSRL